MLDGYSFPGQLNFYAIGAIVETQITSAGSRVPGRLYIGNRLAFTVGDYDLLRSGR